MTPVPPLGTSLRHCDVTSNVIDTEFGHNLGQVFKKMCAKFRFSVSSRCDDIVAELRGGNYMPPPAVGGCREGPAADGLRMLEGLGSG